MYLMDLDRDNIFAIMVWFQSKNLFDRIPAYTKREDVFEHTKLEHTISKKFVEIFDRDFDMGNSCVLIWIGNDKLFNKSRLFDSSINVSSRIEESSMKQNNENVFY